VKTKEEIHFIVINSKILILLVNILYAGMKFFYWVKVIQQSFSVTHKLNGGSRQIWQLIIPWPLNLTVELCCRTLYVHSSKWFLQSHRAELLKNLCRGEFPWTLTIISVRVQTLFCLMRQLWSISLRCVSCQVAHFLLNSRNTHNFLEVMHLYWLNLNQKIFVSSVA